jgi:biotin transport system substrate-specific component
MNHTIAITKKTFWQDIRASTSLSVIAVSSLVAMAFTALLARVSIPLGFTPVPLSLQTFAVMAIAGVAGWKIGAASQILYWGLSMAGMPILAGSETGWLGQSWLTNPVGGWTLATGETAGYILGFILAPLAIGLFNKMWKTDNNSQFGTLLLSNLFIYIPGVIWLAHSYNLNIFASGSGYAKSAFALGVVPFLFVDLIKTVAANVITAPTRG